MATCLESSVAAFSEAGACSVTILDASDVAGGGGGLEESSLLHPAAMSRTEQSDTDMVIFMRANMRSPAPNANPNAQAF